MGHACGSLHREVAEIATTRSARTREDAGHCARAEQHVQRRAVVPSDHGALQRRMREQQVGSVTNRLTLGPIASDRVLHDR
ncbi:MAG: hypothetical protein ACK56F_00440, partial [bacterium]